MQLLPTDTSRPPLESATTQPSFVLLYEHGGIPQEQLAVVLGIPGLVLESYVFSMLVVRGPLTLTLLRKYLKPYPGWTVGFETESFEPLDVR